MVVLAWHGEIGGAVVLRVVAHVWRWRSVHVRVTALLCLLCTAGVAHLHVRLLVSESLCLSL